MPLLMIPLGVLLATLTIPVVQAQPATAVSTADQTDEYVRYELLAPDTASFRTTFEVSVTAAGRREFVERITRGTEVVRASAIDLMTGAPLIVRTAADAVTVTLARPVPAKGQGRIRIEQTVKASGRYRVDGPRAIFTQPLDSPRGSVVLPAGFELVSCNLPAQVLSEPDGRIALSFMHQPGGSNTQLVMILRAGAAVGAAAAPRPPGTGRSWEPPPAQGPTERARLTERARQDRDITYFLAEPSTSAFSLFHDYTESRPGTDKYINVVREGSRVSNPSAYILDTGEALTDETLKGSAITDAKLDIGQSVTPDTEVVVVRFPAVKAGQSIRLRISETYTAPQSYRLEGDDLVFERSLGRARNSVVLPAAWYLTASSIPAIVSETPDGRIRLDFMNGRPDSLDVLIKARRRPGK